LDENPNEAHDRRTLHPSDTPLNRMDVAALKLLEVVNGLSRIEIVKIAFHTSAPGPEEIAYLELRSTDLPEDAFAANLYASIELPLARIVETPVEELITLLKRCLISLTTIAQTADPPPQTTLMTN
jgi:hypothetical protein